MHSETAIPPKKRKLKAITTSLDSRLLDCYERLKKDLGARSDGETLRVIIYGYYKDRYRCESV